MSGLDGIVAGVADDIVPGLQYSLATKRGAKYVKQRNNSTLLPKHVQHLLGVDGAEDDPRCSSPTRGRRCST
jgi:hypothetical protein